MTINARRTLPGARPQQPSKSPRWGLGLLTLAAIASVASMVHGLGANTTSSPAPTLPPAAPVVGKEPYDPYVRKDEPEMFASWGANGVQRINRLRIAAAEQTARSGACDRVEASDLDDHWSQAHHRPRVFVDCANQQRFYVTEADLGRSLLSETEKGARWSRQDAIDTCTAAVRARLRIPASLARDPFGTSAFQAETTGRWVVDFDFKARNALGLRLPADAHCVLTTDGHPDLRISAN